MLQLFTLFGKENEQMYITDVIGWRGKLNKTCCFKMNLLWTQRGKLQRKRENKDIKLWEFKLLHQISQLFGKCILNYSKTLQQKHKNHDKHSPGREHVLFIQFPCLCWFVYAGRTAFFSLQKVQKIWNASLQRYTKICLQLACTIPKWALSHVWYLSTLTHISKRNPGCLLR